jgi:hypothetical protein
MQVRTLHINTLTLKAYLPPQQKPICHPSKSLSATPATPLMWLGTQQNASRVSSSVGVSCSSMGLPAHAGLTHSGIHSLYCIVMSLHFFVALSHPAADAQPQGHATQVTVCHVIRTCVFRVVRNADRACTPYHLVSLLLPPGVGACWPRFHQLACIRHWTPPHGLRCGKQTAAGSIAASSASWQQQQQQQ